MSEIIKALEAPVNENIPELRPGDDVSVHLRIREGERERIQESARANATRRCSPPDKVYG